MRHRINPANSGFALVVTLSLMVLVVLLMVAMLSLSSVNTRQQNADAELVEARANAKLGLKLAIGELQKSMGPDQRISSRALSLAQDQRLGVGVNENDPRSLWVGVAGSQPGLGLDGETAVSTSNPAAVWLVSGLNSGTPASSQLTQAFDRPVTMFGASSIDLSLTGNQPLTAGVVELAGARQGRTGGFAYYVDDEGMKAALAPGRNLVNTTSPTSEGDLTPGAYDLSILEGMSSMQGKPLSVYNRLLTIDDLALVGGNTALAANKRLSYTTFSRGVLCDVKNGGLKRDLTAAFENDLTFNEVFPVGNTPDYLLIEGDKLVDCADLQENGYIHWEVFKDHYNIKRHIKTHTDGTKYLDPVRYTKAGVMMWNNGGPPGGWAVNPKGDPAGGNMGSLLMAGRLGPHNMGDDEYVAELGAYDQMMGLPYGDYQVEPSNPYTSKNHEEFKHSPVIPILQRFQTNAWMEQMDNQTLRTHAQVWSSHYNPYNISLFVAGDSGGPRILATPDISGNSNVLNERVFKYKHENFNVGPRIEYSRFKHLGFTSKKYQFHTKDKVMLLPGRSHVLAYESDAEMGVDKTQDGFLYNDKVKDLTVESVYRDLTHVVKIGSDWVPADLPLSYDMKIRMGLKFTSLHHGVDDNNGGPGNFEVCQSFWAPLAWNKVNSRPGKEFDFGTVTAATLNENLMASLGFNLRTTREPGSDIRPLVDANIRCLFGNTRWDSPLGVSTMAAYSEMNQGQMDEMIMQMSTVDEPKGYTYWGAGRDPSFGYERVILFDVPRSDLFSLGQLQHAGAGRFSYEPSYIVGNSYANPRISQTEWRESITDTFSTSARGLDIFPIDDPFNLYDASYLVNEVLWDRYTFTTIPQVKDNVASLFEPEPNDAHFQALANGAADLPNARYLPYEPFGSNFDRSTLQMSSDRASGTGAFYHNAGHLLVDGAFNVNSTSVDAWEAFLSSTHSMPVEKVNDKGVITGFDAAIDSVRFPRVRSVFGDGMKKSDFDENYWTGFRALQQTEIRELAEAVVEEVKKRGPFLSLGDFVNRKLQDGELGEAGALQAALDYTVNTDIDRDFAIDEQGAGFPGQLLQGDVLQALAPYMTVRSDVFTIRAYGESVDETTGNVLARAWCEAKVQRIPDPVKWGGASGDALKELSNPSSPFGRQFRVISFRWLNPDEV